MKRTAMIGAIAFAFALSSCGRESLLGPDEADAPYLAAAPGVAATGQVPRPVSPRAATPTWSPNVETLQTAEDSIEALYDSPGCDDATLLASRLDAVWDLWFGRVEREPQPAYEPLVVTPVRTIAQQCGLDYIYDVAEAFRANRDALMALTGGVAAPSEGSTEPTR